MAQKKPTTREQVFRYQVTAPAFHAGLYYKPSDEVLTFPYKVDNPNFQLIKDPPPAKPVPTARVEEG